MKQKDLHAKQQEELKKQDVSSVRGQGKTDDVRTSNKSNPDKRDVAGETKRQTLNILLWIKKDVL